jgi:hypothetical protein
MTAEMVAASSAAGWRTLAAMEDDASRDRIWRAAAAKDHWFNRLPEDMSLARAIVRGGLARDRAELDEMVQANLRWSEGSPGANCRYAAALVRGWVAVHGAAS